LSQALIALKDLVRAKTRLAGILAPSERRALAQAMVEDVLATLATHPRIARVTLVSDDPAAHLLAAQYGARHWTESGLRRRGLNAVLQRASQLLPTAEPGSLVVLHADLPLLAAGDISAVLAAREETGGLIVGCDRHGTGTNLLCFDDRSPPEFCFGEDSCRRHLEAARAAGMPASVLRRRGIELDVDEVRDLAELLQAQPEQLVGRRTADLLHSAGLGARIALALASLAGGEIPSDSEEAV